MSRTAWRILGAAGALAAAVAAAALAWLQVNGVDRVVEAIRTEVRATTGRDLVVRGGARLALRPEPTVVLSDVAIANAPWGRAPALATASRLEARIALPPILRGRIAASRIDVDGATIFLEADGHGHGNWEAPGAPRSPAPIVAPADLQRTDPVEIGFRDATAIFGSAVAATPARVAVETLTLRARDVASSIEIDVRAEMGGVPVFATGWLGAYDALRERRWPYRIDLAGKVAGQPARIASAVRVEGDTYVFDELVLGYSSNGFKGSVAITPGEPRPRVVVHASTKSIRVADLPWGADTTSQPPWLVATLRAADVDLALEAGIVWFGGGWQLNRVDAHAVVRDGRLETPALTATAYGGPLSARATIDATRDDAVSAAIRLSASDVDLAALFQAIGAAREVRGARAAVDADLAGRGASLREWASTAAGSATMRVGPGAIAARAGGAPGRFDELLAAISPPAPDGSIGIRCAVVHVGVSGGVARIAHAAFATTAGTVAQARGSFDLGRERIDVAVVPVRTGAARGGRHEGPGPVRVEGALAGPTVRVAEAAKVAAPVPGAGSDPCAAVASGNWRRR